MMSASVPAIRRAGALLALGAGAFVVALGRVLGHLIRKASGPATLAPAPVRSR